MRCRECNQTFKSVNGSTSSALRHLRQKHPELEKAFNSAAGQTDRSIWTFFCRESEASEDATCARCDTSIALKDGGDVSNLVMHLESEHPEEHARYEKLKLSSPGQPGSLRKVKLMHRVKKNEKKSAIWFYFERTSNRMEHTCKACLKVFQCKKKNSANLIRHLKQFHTALYDRFMKDCGYTAEEIDAFKVTRKRGPKPKSEEEALQARTCPQCSKVYSTKKNMELHLEAVHSGKRPFACDECGMTFARKESYNRHTHNSRKPFLCSVCGKTFARRHIRDVHEK